MNLPQRRQQHHVASGVGAVVCSHCGNKRTTPAPTGVCDTNDMRGAYLHASEAAVSGNMAHEHEHCEWISPMKPMKCCTAVALDIGVSTWCHHLCIATWAIASIRHQSRVGSHSMIGYRRIVQQLQLDLISFEVAISPDS